MTDATAVVLTKADLLPAWPYYAPVLAPQPASTRLPWAPPAGGPLTGEIKETRVTLRPKNSANAGPAGGGEVVMRCLRERAAFGPGDNVHVVVDLSWHGANALRVTRLDAVLRETLTFRYPNAATPSRPAQRVNAVFTATARIAEGTDGSTLANGNGVAILYPHERARSFVVTGVVPRAHARVTVRTAKHIDVAYHVKIRAMLAGGDEVAVDHWPVTIGHCGVRDARALIDEIGYTEGLCDRAGLEHVSSYDARQSPPPSALPSALPSPPPPPPPPPHSPLANTSTNRPRQVSVASMLSTSARTFGSPGTPPAISHQSFHIARPAPIPSPAPASTPVSSPAPVAPLARSLALASTPPTAASPPLKIARPTPRHTPASVEEKVRLHREAERTRDELQARVTASAEKSRLFDEATRLRDAVQLKQSLKACDQTPTPHEELDEASPSPPLMTGGLMRTASEEKRLLTIEQARRAATRAAEHAREELERQQAVLAAIDAEAAEAQADAQSRATRQQELTREAEEARRREEEAERILRQHQAERRAREEEARRFQAKLLARQQHAKEREERLKAEESKAEERAREQERLRLRLEEEEQRAQERLDLERLERQRLEQERLDQENAARENAVRERVEKARRERDRLDPARLERQRDLERREAELARQMRELELERARADEISTPSSTLHIASSPSYGRSNGLQRALSSASTATFAPSTSASNATASYYAQMLAGSRSPPPLPPHANGAGDRRAGKRPSMAPGAPDGLPSYEGSSALRSASDEKAELDRYEGARDLPLSALSLAHNALQRPRLLSSAISTRRKAPRQSLARHLRPFRREQCRLSTRSRMATTRMATTSLRRRVYVRIAASIFSKTRLGDELTSLNARMKSAGSQRL